MSAAPGEVVAGRYRVTDRTADGGLLARDVRSGEAVLLHALELPELLIPGQLISTPDPEYGARLAEQVAAVGRGVPGHPRLLRGVEVFADAALLWVAEERPPGMALADFAGPVPPYRVAELAVDLSAALRALHEAGLAHGNISAESVVVCEDGAAMLGGLLRGAAEEELCAALGGPVPRRVYEARAVLLGPRAERWAMEAGPEADCWALGVLLYRLLTGWGPYPEHDLPTLLAAVRDGRHEPAGGPLGPLVEQLLQLNAAARPTAAQVRLQLGELLAAAPEPYGQERSLLPVIRPQAQLVPRQKRWWR